jgi:pectinesterase
MRSSVLNVHARGKPKMRGLWFGAVGLTFVLIGAQACSSDASESNAGGSGSGPSGSGSGSSGASAGTAANGAAGSTGTRGTGGGGTGGGGTRGGTTGTGTGNGDTGTTAAAGTSSGAGSGVSGAVGSAGSVSGSSRSGSSDSPGGGGSTTVVDSGLHGGLDSGMQGALVDSGSTVVDAGPVVAGTATRPQLSDAQAANDTILKYLAQAGTIGSLVTDAWNPIAGLGLATGFTPHFTVAADGSGTHMTVQAAITAAGTVAGASRVYIEVKPGMYKELVCVSAGSPPITLYSTNTDASQTVIAFDEFAGNDASTGNPCNPSTSSTTGTFSSATFMAFADGFQAKNLTIANDYPATSSGSGQQAVALMTEADSIILENVRVLGFQDTLFLHTSSTSKVARVYIKSSYIEGDTDFIFGRATLVVDGGTINYVTSRRAGGGTVVAPSTDPGNSYGFLLTGVNFTQTGALNNSVYLGRAWDNGVASAAAYVVGTSPNGQAVIAESSLGAFIRTADPWETAATSQRPFSTTGNRLFEYRNSGPGAAQ